MDQALPIRKEEGGKMRSILARTRQSSGSRQPGIFRWLASIYELGDAKRSRMQTLEGLRGLAILLVFLCHYDLIILARLPIGPVLDRLGRVVRDVGGTGVDLFFVLSGFLIYRAVLKPNMKYNSFLVRRAQRIYPTFLAVLAMYITADVFLITRLHIGTEYHRIPQDFKHAIVYLLENVTFLPGLFPIQPIMNVAWSLSYECFFYLFLPIIIVTTASLPGDPRIA
jgi:peptidoglycan/LPS O-acetylase OafA/YrhL